jgi:hypothetical protein
VFLRDLFKQISASKIEGFLKLLALAGTYFLRPKNRIIY